MRDFADSTLWNLSAFERQRLETGHSGYNRLDEVSVLPTTVLSDLRRLRADPATDDVVEALAAFMRHREPALLFLQHEQLVWPVTLFPQQMQYHAPRDLVVESASRGLAALQLLSAEPPGVRPPPVWPRTDDLYRPLAPLLWAAALEGPRGALLAEIAGRAAYRLVPSRGAERPTAHGALLPALQRLQRESVSLREMASWPGMSVERASRLLNALYLTGCLLVSRTHPAARSAPGFIRGLFGDRR